MSRTFAAHTPLEALALEHALLLARQPQTAVDGAPMDRSSLASKPLPYLLPANSPSRPSSWPSKPRLPPSK